MQTGGCWLGSAFCSYLSLAVQREIGEYFPSCLFPFLSFTPPLALIQLNQFSFSPLEFVYIKIGKMSPPFPNSSIGSVYVFLMGCVSSVDLSSRTEGEEIDVVTVEKRQSLGVRKPVTITVRADPLDPCMKHFHISIHQQQHNYAARFPPESCSQGEAPEPGPREGLEREAPEEKEDEADEEIVSLPPVESEPSQPCNPKPVSSDTEDVTKRKNHNFLERKRRNDLRSRFLALRDQVPTLATCSKAPKVVILSKALEYLQALVGAEKRMATEKRQLRCRQQQLQKRIAYLSGY